MRDCDDDDDSKGEAFREIMNFLKVMPEIL